MQQYSLNYHFNLSSTQTMAYHAERLAPRKFKFKTGQLIKVLSENPAGLTRTELLFFFCQNFDSASLTRRESLRMSTEKIIQRARTSFEKFNLTILYDKNEKKYFLSTSERECGGGLRCEASQARGDARIQYT